MWSELMESGNGILSQLIKRAREDMGYRHRYRHRSGTGLISGIAQRLASCPCAPQKALLLVQGSLARDDQAVKISGYGRSARR